MISNTEVGNTEVGSMSVWFEDRGYGFVNVLGTRYFLHRAHILFGSPVKGAIVRFIPSVQTKGVICTHVEIFADFFEMQRYDASVALMTAAAPNSEKGGNGGERRT